MQGHLHIGVSLYPIRDSPIMDHSFIEVTRLRVIPNQGYAYPLHFDRIRLDKHPACDSLIVGIGTDCNASGLTARRLRMTDQRSDLQKIKNKKQNKLKISKKSMEIQCFTLY